jgi:hypothetical protein
MILVVQRTGMVVVVRVGARLFRRMGKNPPAGFLCGTALARRSAALEKQMKLVECWRCDPGEIEHQEHRCTVSHPCHPVGSKSPSAHATTHDELT